MKGCIQIGFIFFLVILSNLALANLSGGKIKGHIRSPQGEELPGANVILEPNQKLYVTDEKGDFEIRGLNHGFYCIKVFYVGYDTLEYHVHLGGNDLELNLLLKPNDRHLEELIITADAFKTGRIENSLTTHSLGHCEVKKVNAATLINAIERLPGVSSMNTGVGIAKPIIRGMSFNRVIVLDRGIKQEGQQWGADHGLEIDQFEPGRIEVIKGPSSLFYGSDGIGGVINILPMPEPHNNKLGGEVFTTYKSNNDLYGTTAMIEGDQNDTYFRLRATAISFADYQVPASSFRYNSYILPIYNDRLKNTAGQELNFSGTFGIRKDWGRSSVYISNFNQKAGLFQGATGVPRAYQLTHDGDYRNIDFPRQRTQHFKVISNTTIGNGTNWMAIDLGYQRNNRNEEGIPHIHGYQPTPEGNLALGLTLETLTANTRYHHSINDKLRNTYGVQLQQQFNTHRGFEFLLPSFRAFNAGAFSHLEYSYSKELTLNGGIRFDMGTRDIDEFREPDYTTLDETDSITRNPDINRSFRDFSGALGLSWSPSQHYNIKANLGSSFRMPTAPELSSNGVHHGTFRHERGDETLDSERGLQFDVNFTYSKKEFYFLFTPFIGYFHNYIYLRPGTSFSNLPAGGQVWQYTQHNALFTGFELTTDVHFTENLLLRPAIEYVYNYNFQTGLSLPFTPPFSTFTELEYSPELRTNVIKNPYLSFSARWFADQNRRDRNEMVTPGAALFHFNMGFGIKVFGQLAEFNFGVENLTNTKYMMHTSRYRLLNLPEQGRNFIFSLRIPLGIE